MQKYEYSSDLAYEIGIIIEALAGENKHKSRRTKIQSIRVEKSFILPHKCPVKRYST